MLGKLGGRLLCQWVALVGVFGVVLAMSSGDISKCCGKTSDALFHCITREKSLMETHEQVVDITRPTLNVAIVMYNSDSYVDQSHQLTGAINQLYAQHHGYYFHTLNVSDANRLQLLNEALDSFLVDMDYVLVLPPDIAFIDFTFRIERMLSRKYRKYHLIFTEGMVGTGLERDTGLFLLRNSPAGRDVIADWYRTSKHLHLGEQAAFESYYKRNAEEAEDLIKTLPSSILYNAYPAATSLTDSSKMLHLYNEHTDYKVHILSDVFNNLCSKSPPVHGLTTAKMLTASLQIYTDLLESALDAYTDLAPVGGNNGTITDRLYMYMYHLCLAYDHKYGGEKGSEGRGTEESAALRGRVFKQMIVNMKQLRNLREDGAHVDGDDWALLLKSVVRTGQDYLVRLQEPRQRVVMSKLVKDAMEELVAVRPDDNDTKEALVNMYVDLGTTDMRDKKYDDAHRNFIDALAIAKQVEAAVGEQVKLAPLSYAADALVMMERYDEAIVLYNKALPIVSKFLGAGDVAVPLMKVQLANAYFMNGQMKKARESAEGALGDLGEIPSIDQDEQLMDTVKLANTIIAQSKGSGRRKDL